MQRPLVALAFLQACAAFGLAPLMPTVVRRAPVLRQSVVPLAVAMTATKPGADAGEKRAVGDRDSGRHLDAGASTARTVGDIYAPFWDYAAKCLQDRLGADLSSYPIPDGYERKEASMGKGKREATAWTQSYGYQTTKLRQIRAALVNGGPNIQVLNFVIFPHMNFDLPFLGLDLVTLPGGHLIAIDMQPLFQTEEYQRKYAAPCTDIFEKHVKNLPWGGDFPEEAKAYFSPNFLWTRPQEDQVVQTHVFEAFKDYLNRYLDLVEAAQPETDPKKLEEIATRQMAYLKYRAEKDPARGMFTRMYGPEWTETYIHEFLFDLEEKMDKGLYKVGQKLASSAPLNFLPTRVKDPAPKDGYSDREGYYKVPKVVGSADTTYANSKRPWDL